jgi:hypothetical protein
VEKGDILAAIVRDTAEVRLLFILQRARHCFQQQVEPVVTPVPVMFLEVLVRAEIKQTIQAELAVSGKMEVVVVEAEVVLGIMVVVPMAIIKDALAPLAMVVVVTQELVGKEGPVQMVIQVGVTVVVAAAVLILTEMVVTVQMVLLSLLTKCLKCFHHLDTAYRLQN